MFTACMVAKPSIVCIYITIVLIKQLYYCVYIYYYSIDQAAVVLCVGESCR